MSLHELLDAAKQHVAAQRFADAVGMVEPLLASASSPAEAGETLYQLVRLLVDAGDSGGALEIIRRAVRAGVVDSRLLLQAWVLVRRRDGWAATAPIGRDRLVADPAECTAWVDLGSAFVDEGDHDNAQRAFRRALLADPGDLYARFVAERNLPRLYRDEAEIVQARAAYTAGLATLESHVCSASRRSMGQALGGINTLTNFYLAYQAQDDRALQTQYGDIVGAIVRRAFPAPSVHRKRRRERPRIAFVSYCLSLHTVLKLFIGWLERIDRTRFELVAIHLGEVSDYGTERVRRSVDHFFHLPRSWHRVASKLAELAPDAIIYPEIGMAPQTLMLGALRLAPVQCVAWGHPVTTGLREMDYFLSSELMEPPDGDAHYTERLVRLPNLSIYYNRPGPIPPRARQDLPVPADGILYLACQSTFKYLPQHDDIYPAIAAEVPDARFLFILDTAKVAHAIFSNRLVAAFERHGLDPARHCHFMPRLDPLTYLAVNRIADVFLDSFEWSGGNTSLEALAYGVPALTCPGRFMRGRHTFAMLRRMDLLEGIAEDPADYVRKAARLGREPGLREEIRGLTVERAPRLYGDRAAIDGFARFLDWAIAQS